MKASRRILHEEVSVMQTPMGVSARAPAVASCLLISLVIKAMMTLEQAKTRLEKRSQADRPAVARTSAVASAWPSAAKRCLLDTNALSRPSKAWSGSSRLSLKLSRR